MSNFQYLSASALDEAAAKVKGAQDGALLAGGMTLLPSIKLGLSDPSDIVDLAGIGDLSGIDVEGGSVTIGAMTRHAEVAGSSEVATAIPALAALTGGIGDLQVRNRGTIGGSIANNDPAADYPAAVIALGATVRTNKRDISGDEFFIGMFETVLAEDEVIVSVSFPKAGTAAYMKFENPASRYAIVGVFLVKFIDGVRVGVTGATACAHRGMRLEEALNSTFTADAIDSVELPIEKMNADIHASAEYRAHLVKVMTKRAVEACV